MLKYRPLYRGSISAWAEAPRGLSDGLGRAEVYLRVGGGTERVCESVGLNPGLSPRGRRHHDPEGARPLRRGSISAWAEAPARAAPPGAHLRVYLRVGGGTQAQRRVGHRVQGLSPRGRRHRNCGAFRGHLARSISAWAEAPRSSPASPRCRGVYLRVGGGTSRDPSECDPSEGLSPRGRRHPSFILSRPPGKPGDPP